MAVKPISRVLVIKLGGVGEMVLAFPAFERIRQAHPRAKITLLTTQPFAQLATSSPFFNAVDADGGARDPASWAALILRIRRGRFDRVYDLQNDASTNLILQALRPNAPEWSGTALGASLPHKNRDRRRMHPLERQASQLEDAGIWPDAPTKPLSAAPPDISWILARSAQPRSVSVAGGHRALVLLAPGGDPHHLETRWPVERYGDFARRMQDAGFDIVIIGGLSESPLAHAIQRKSPRARDLTGRTDLAQIAALGARAALAVGNDLGPLHLIAAAGAPTIALFNSAPDPALTAPRGHVTVLHAPQLKDLPVDTVASAATILARAPS
ncbi:MAG TPA: glycosyltransferase family 9 protein [Caulobacteraceae bacterium]|nr:glycosyltransferase family 9 protein [Caulobacteraceae bacterium]